MTLHGFAQCLLAAVGGNSSLVVFPSSANYSAIVAPYNLDQPAAPAAVAFPSSAVQVAGLVNCAVASDYRVQAKSGGHSSGNYGSTTGELSINLENFSQFSVDPSTFEAKIGPGLRLEQVDELLHDAGRRFIPHGTCGQVGIGGHATVGGAGFTGRQYGLAIDYIIEVEVVLANSTIVRASASQHPDLFFAMRGAGASFGIVTEFVFRTLPSPPLTVNYALAWTATDVPSRAAIFKAWQAWVSNPLPWTLQSTLTVVPTGIAMSGAFFGSLDAFAALNISAAFPAAQQATAELYTDFQQLSQLWAQEITESGMEAPSYFYSKSLVTRPQTRLPDSAVDRLFEYLATADDGVSNTNTNTTAGAGSWLLEFEAGGGRYGAVAADATAFPHRDALYILLAHVTTGGGSVGPATVRFVRGLETVVKSAHPDAYYGEYAGYVDVREAPDQAAYHYWGNNLPRLRRIKSVLDPGDVFHNPQGVRPL